MWDDQDYDMQLTDSEAKEELRRVLATSTTTSTDNSENVPRWFILPSAAAIASLGGITFGYDIGIISGALLQLRCTFNLSCYQQAMIVTTLVIGALVSSFCGGFLLDKYGRKRTITINALMFIGGAAVLTGAQSYAIFIVGRFIVGFCVSLSAVSDCIYISEVASSKWRGMLVSMNEMGITLGILLAYLANYLLVSIPNGWRLMFAISAAPALLQVVGMFFLPESPRWLINQGKDVKATNVVKLLWPHVDPVQEIDRLKNSISTENKYRLTDLFSKKENLRMRMMIGCGIVFFQQLTGQPTVLYYAPVLLQNLGYNSNDSATLATLGLGVMKVVFTFITLCTVDKLGRRTFLLIGATIMTVSLVTLSGLTVSFRDYGSSQCHEVAGTSRLHNHLLKPNNPCNVILNSSVACEVINDKGINLTLSNCSSMSNSTHATNDEIPSSVKYTSLIALTFFVIGFAVGYGPISWLLLSEIFPTGIKGRAVSIVSSVNWAANMLLCMTFLEMITTLGPFGIFLLYSMVGILSIFFICQFVPETRGKSLEMLSVELSETLDLPCSFAICSDAEHLRIDDEECQLLENNNLEGLTEC